MKNLFTSSLLRVVDFLVLTIFGVLAYYQVIYIGGRELIFEQYFALVVTVAFVFILINPRLYRSTRSHGFFELSHSILISIGKAWVILFIWLVFTKTNILYSRLWLILWAFESCFALLFCRYRAYFVLGKLRSNKKNLRHVVIIGDGKTADELIFRLNKLSHNGFNLLRHISKPSEDNLIEISKSSADEIWIVSPMGSQGMLEVTMNHLKDSMANIRFVPDWFSYRLINHGVSEVLGIQMIGLYGTPMGGANLLIKTIEDYLISLIILIMVSPIMCILAIGVKLSSPGPVFYKQKRVGWNGQLFDILKFRTMPVDVESNSLTWGGSQRKVQNGFCRLLRRTSLDELPQFINVLKGEMSIVGPRPERPEFVERFKEEIPGYMKKHLVKAGITGWAQIHGWRGDTDLHSRIEHDLYYIDNWSLALDLKIIFYTPWWGLIHKNAH